MSVGAAKQPIDVKQLATALKANGSIDKLLPKKVQGLVDRIAEGRLDAQEYARFKRISQTNSGIRAGRFAATAKAFTKNNGLIAERAAFVILALEKSGHKDAAVSLLHRVFKDVAAVEIPKLGFRKE